MTTAPQGRLTFRIAAVFFGLSALAEVLTLNVAVPLFGAIVGGAGAIAYHVLYIVLFAGLAVGLWTGSRNGYYTLFVTTVVYTIDRLQLMFAPDSLIALLTEQPMGEELVATVGREAVVQSLMIVTITIVLCWWGFAVFAYYRRAYFGITALPGSSESFKA